MTWGVDDTSTLIHHPNYDICVYTVPFMKMIRSIAPFRKPLRLGRDCSCVSDDRGELSLSASTLLNAIRMYLHSFINLPIQRV